MATLRRWSSVHHPMDVVELSLFVWVVCPTSPSAGSRLRRPSTCYRECPLWVESGHYEGETTYSVLLRLGAECRTQLANEGGRMIKVLAGVAMILCGLNASQTLATPVQYSFTTGAPVSIFSPGGVLFAPSAFTLFGGASGTFDYDSQAPQLG